MVRAELGADSVTHLLRSHLRQNKFNFLNGNTALVCLAEDPECFPVAGLRVPALVSQHLAQSASKGRPGDFPCAVPHLVGDLPHLLLARVEAAGRTISVDDRIILVNSYQRRNTRWSSLKTFCQQINFQHHIKYLQVCSYGWKDGSRYLCNVKES